MKNILLSVLLLSCFIGAAQQTDVMAKLDREWLRMYHHNKIPMYESFVVLINGDSVKGQLMVASPFGPGLKVEGSEEMMSWKIEEIESWGIAMQRDTAVFEKVTHQKREELWLNAGVGDISFWGRPVRGSTQYMVEGGSVEEETGFAGTMWYWYAALEDNQFVLLGNETQAKTKKLAKLLQEDCPALSKKILDQDREVYTKSVGSHVKVLDYSEVQRQYELCID